MTPEDDPLPSDDDFAPVVPHEPMTLERKRFLADSYARARRRPAEVYNPFDNSSD